MLIVELKFINQCPTRYDRSVATSLRAAVNKREQQLYQEYLTRLRLKDRNLNTPDGTVGPLERGLINATNSGESFDGWVVGFYGEWSDKLTKLPETLAGLGPMHLHYWRSMSPLTVLVKASMCYATTALVLGACISF